jgi:SPP1 gp7 family putative phage head morphogenesis protein
MIPALPKTPIKKKGRKNRILWLPPSALERKYIKILRNIVKEIKINVNNELFPLIKDELKESLSRNDTILDILNGYFISLKSSLSFSEGIARNQMREIGKSISGFNKAQFDKVAREYFGIDIFLADPDLNEALDIFASMNTTLIGSLADKAIDDIKMNVMAGIQGGLRFTDIAENIKKSLEISDRRAKFIARDQVSKLNSDLSQLRQESLGVTKYIWQTSKDERVRKTHMANEGKTFKWSKPPKTGHPGHDFNCRCVAIPILEDLLDE